MNKKLIFFVVVPVVVLAVVYLAVVKPMLDNRTESVVVYQLAQNEQLEIQFSYPSGEDGYSMIEPPVEAPMLDAWILMSTPEYISFQGGESTETPASMSVFVFSLPDDTSEGEQVGRITRLQNWAQSNSGITAYDRIYGTPDVVEIDGVKALEYTTDGLYQQTVYLASYRSRVYMFVGQYDRPTDAIKSDFETLIQSVHFE